MQFPKFHFQFLFRDLCAPFAALQFISCIPCFIFLFILQSLWSWFGLCLRSVTYLNIESARRVTLAGEKHEKFSQVISYQTRRNMCGEDGWYQFILLNRTFAFYLENVYNWIFKHLSKHSPRWHYKKKERENLDIFQKLFFFLCLFRATVFIIK